eukprot:784032-Pleurochrysis_carterae.AAC.1
MWPSTDCPQSGARGQLCAARRRAHVRVRVRSTVTTSASLTPPRRADSTAWCTRYASNSED